MNINEAVQKIKKAGITNVRVLPMDGQSFNGLHKIEIRNGGAWGMVVEGLEKAMAEGIVRQAVNKVILG
jgi:molybdenum cofactor biosynthesis enzyme MoaA